MSFMSQIKCNSLRNCSQFFANDCPQTLCQGLNMVSSWRRKSKEAFYISQFYHNLNTIWIIFLRFQLYFRLWFLYQLYVYTSFLDISLSLCTNCIRHRRGILSFFSKMFIESVEFLYWREIPFRLFSRAVNT